jgi:hypothetical protein
MKRGRAILSYLLLVVFVVAIAHYLRTSVDFSSLPAPTFSDVLISLTLASVIYLLSGLQISLGLAHLTGVRLKPLELFTLPVTMRLWSYILPAKGGMIYSLAFLKAQYDLTLSGGFSLSLYLYIVTLCLGGLVGIFLSLQDDLGMYFLLVSIAFTLSPVLFLLSPIMGKWQRFQSFAEQLSTLAKCPWLVGKITALNILHTAVSGIWFYLLGVSLNLDISLTAAILLALLLKASIILKLTPGNLGFEQFLSGGVLAALGYQASSGMLISLAALATTLLLNVPIGFICTLKLARRTQLSLVP